MRPSTERSHSQAGVYVTSANGNFAKYNSLTRAADDIVLYMKARQWPTHELSLFEFVSTMKNKGYFVEPMNFYLNAVEAWLQR